MNWWFTRRPIVNNVCMFATSKENCLECRGTGWFRYYADRCLIRCHCVDPTEKVRGNK